MLVPWPRARRQSSQVIPLPARNRSHYHDDNASVLLSFGLWVHQLLVMSREMPPSVPVIIYQRRVGEYPGVYSSRCHWHQLIHCTAASEYRANRSSDNAELVLV